jgi:transcriptional regulator with XRE-family HTH domain
MGSPKSRVALKRLGQDIRDARLRRSMAVTDLAVRAGVSPNTILRLEHGEPGVGIGTLADTLVVLGLIDRLGDLIDIRKDELGLALTNERAPRRARSYATKLRRQKARQGETPAGGDTIDPDGVAF